MIDKIVKKIYIMPTETKRNKIKQRKEEGIKMMKRGMAAFLTGIMGVSLAIAGLTGCGRSTKGQIDGMVTF